MSTLVHHARSGLLFFATLLAACIAGPVGEDTDAQEDSADTELACDELDDANDCAAAGCHWLDTAGLVVDVDAGTCEPGAPIGLCYAPAQAQPCDASAMVCDDGLHVWVLWGPDGGAVVGRSTSSCDVAEGFMPCGDDDTMNEAQSLACACACD